MVIAHVRPLFFDQIFQRIGDAYSRDTGKGRLFQSLPVLCGQDRSQSGGWSEEHQDVTRGTDRFTASGYLDLLRLDCSATQDQRGKRTP